MLRALIRTTNSLFYGSVLSHSHKQLNYSSLDKTHSGREALKTNTHDRWEEMLSTAGFIFTTCFIPSVAGSPPSCMTDNERPSASKLSSL